jgi:hypothetical protein
MFDSALLKIERAERHIDDLEQTFKLFVKSQEHKVCVTNDPKTGDLLFEVVFSRGIPSELALIAGDAIHNLRTALDHATWELVGVDCGKQDRNLAFPAGKTRSDYESACNGIDTPRDDTKQFLLSLEAFPGGLGQNLYGLRALDNLDKHQILTPIIGVTRLGKVEIIFPDGQRSMTMENCSFTLGEDGRARLVGSGPGHTIRFEDGDHQIEFDISFGSVEFFRMAPLIDTLVELRIAISNVVGQFDELVRGRTWC